MGGTAVGGPGVTPRTGNDAVAHYSNEVGLSVSLIKKMTENAPPAQCRSVSFQGEGGLDL